jgi:hypothetical protein
MPYHLGTYLVIYGKYEYMAQKYRSHVQKVQHEYGKGIVLNVFIVLRQIQLTWEMM